MLKPSSEAVTDKAKKGLRFSGENEEVLRSPSLNCDTANPTAKRPLKTLEATSRLLK
jgi:hypothetical protein